jgi:predicted TIM-barrel fold metal-dependent hydrolase
MEGEMSTIPSQKDDYFKIDVEAHILGGLDQKYINYFPGWQAWWKSVSSLYRFVFGPPGNPAYPREGELDREHTPEHLLNIMDKHGVDMACILPEVMMNTTGFSTRWVPNGYVAEVCENNKERFIFTPNVGPLLKRGLKNAIWELEYLVKERNAKMVKFYPPEDTYINDPEIWPFYKKVTELNIPIAIHTGWAGILPGLSKYCLPVLLDEVATEFMDMNIIAYHMGYPYQDDLNLIAGTHPNVYIGLSVWVRWALGRPRVFAKLIGEALLFAGPDRIIWGTDYTGVEVSVRTSTEGFRDFEIPEDMQRDYGYPPLTDEDKRKIFGQNLAKLLHIDTSTRKVKV